MRAIIYIGSYIVFSLLADYINPSGSHHFLIGAIFGSTFIRIEWELSKPKNES